MRNEWMKDVRFFGEDDFASAMEQFVVPWRKEFLEEGYLHSFDNTRPHYLFARHPKERAVVVFSHGFCEFSDKYHEILYYFYQMGYSVYFPEHRGHGFSGREVADKNKVYVSSFDVYVRDFKCFMDQVALPDARGRECILFAHSMGGAVGALFLEEYPGVFSKAVLSSPLMEMNYGTIPVWAARLLIVWSSLMRWQERYAPGQHGFDDRYNFAGSSCMSEPRYAYVFRRRQETSEYTTYGGTYAWTNAAAKAMKKLQKHASAVQIPVLLLQAGADSMVKPGGQERFAKVSGNTRVVRFPNAKHELFNALPELREVYYREIFAFLEESGDKV